MEDKAIKILVERALNTYCNWYVKRDLEAMLEKEWIEIPIVSNEDETYNDIWSLFKKRE